MSGHRSGGKFTETEHQVWKSLFSRQKVRLDEQLHPMFVDGIRHLELGETRVPDLEAVNLKLQKLTGFKGVWVEGHENPQSFFPMLARREFPIGDFIRDAEDLDYTPAPDVFHDLYGHLPFLADSQYADFSQKFGESASQYENDPARLRQYERFFWFIFELGLIKTPIGKRILGGGIASSFRECAFSLSEHPEVFPFDLDLIRSQEFKIDEIQKKLFLLDSLEQLYQCLDEFASRVKRT